MLWYLIGAISGIVLTVFLFSFVCFILVFYSARRKALGEDEYDIPSGKIYEPHRDEMIGWMRDVRAMKCEELQIMSFDGLKLYGKYYEYAPGAPVEILFHGYRGSAERDLCGAVERCFAIGRSALIVDQRGAGRSEGRVITFGIREHRDCLAWIDKVIERFGPDVRIILTGISMGASTVMIAAGCKLPNNVVCVLADCGYTSAEAIIKKVIRQLHLPIWPLYSGIKLGARLYGRFDLESCSPIEAVRSCRVPMVFIHGETDDFVPCSMSAELYEACVSPKKIATVPGAGHGLAYPIDKEKYLKTLRDFEKECGFLETK